MSKGINLLGKKEFQGIEINNILGGFGEGKRGILARDIAEIHEVELSSINRNINNNRKRFNDYIDIIDVKQMHEKHLFLEAKIFTKAQVGNANNIYLLSERGYAKLIKIMDDDKSWEVHDNLVDDYFQLKDYKENVQQKLAENDVYTRADELAHKFSIGRTIGTFGEASFTELPVLLDEFKEHLDSIRDSKVRLTRYDSMVKGLERMRGQLDIGLSHHVLEQYVQPLTKERYQLTNRINGGIKGYQTKRINEHEEERQAMMDHIATLTPPSDAEYAVVFKHGFSVNRMYVDLPNGKKRRTKSYDQWFENFPTHYLPDKEYWNVNWDEPLLVRFQFVAVEGSDLDNLIKSAQDVIFNHYKVDDVIIDEANIKRPYYCERYEDGEIRVHISNII